MKGSLCAVLAGCLCSMVLCSASVKAEITGGAGHGGTIEFVGGVFVPTCQAVVDPSYLTGATSEAVIHQQHRQRCSDLVSDAADMRVAHSVSVASLSDSESQEMLRYFYNHAKASHPEAADPVLVIHAYE